MKGQQKGACSGCGAGKGTHDSNAGWWEMGPRRVGGHRLEHLLCPPCTARLLVHLDERMGTAKKFDVIPLTREQAELVAHLLSPGQFDSGVPHGHRYVANQLSKYLAGALVSTPVLTATP